MKQRTLQCNVLKDEGGQALTEFVLVIPVVLLFFFASLQYFTTVQASQLGNYAAYMAARVYAVRASIDENDAKDKAQTAAAMIFAPIARPVPGEIGGPSYGSSLGGIFNTFMGNKLGNFAAGYVMAKYVRLNSSLLGGSVNCSASGSPKQVDVTINYPQPVFIPGFAEMWNFVTGDKIFLGMKPLRQGLQGIPGKLLPVYETIDQAQQYEQMLAQYDPGLASSISSFVSSIPQVMLPYINVQSKSSTGYSDWGSKDPDYRPRKPSSGDESDDSGKSDNPDVNNAQNQVEKAGQDRKNYEDAMADAKQKCTALCNAQSDLQAAHQRDDHVINDPKASDDDKNKAKSDLKKYQDAYDNAKTANSQAESKVSSTGQTLSSDTGQSVPDWSCPCK